MDEYYATPLRNGVLRSREGDWSRDGGISGSLLGLQKYVMALIVPGIFARERGKGVQGLLNRWMKRVMNDNGRNGIGF